MKKIKSSGIRVATKVQGQRIRELAARLRNNPAMVLPECQNSECGKGLFRPCAFSALRKKLESLKDQSNGALAKYAEKRGLIGAVAGTMLLTEEKRIPYLAAKQIGDKTYVYAKRGEADDDKLIAVQNFEDPHIRMLTVMDIVTKKGLYLYSTETRMICMGNNATPPSEFISFILQRLDLPNGQCEHLASTDDRVHLALYWKPAQITLKICIDCAGRNTLLVMTQYFYSPKLKEEIDVTVKGSFIVCHESCDHCPIDVALTVQVDTDSYFSGQHSDNEFINNWKKKVRWNIEKLNTRVFVINGVCYGENVDAVINELNPQPWEEDGLRLVLSRLEKPLVLMNATPNKILSQFWDEYGPKIVHQIAGDQGTNIFNRHNKHTPSEILELVHNEKEKQEVLATLHIYDPLPPLADFAHRVAFAFRVGGTREAIQVIHAEDMDIKKKSIAYAFLLSMDKASGEQWKYSEMEKDYGTHLCNYTHAMLREEGDAYRNAMQELLTAAGSTEKLGE